MREKARIKDEDLKFEDTLSLEGRSERISHSRSVFQTQSYCPVVEIVEAYMSISKKLSKTQNYFIHLFVEAIVLVPLWILACKNYLNITLDSRLELHDAYYY